MAWLSGKPKVQHFTPPPLRFLARRYEQLIRKDMRHIFGMLILSLFLGACKNTCEGFPESELRWTPFEVSEKIKYFHDGETLEFTVTDKFYSTESKYGGESFPEACTPTAWYQTNELNSISIYEKVELMFSDPSMITSFSSNSIFFYELRDGYSFDSVSVRHIGDTVINGIQFDEVFKIEKDSQNGINWFIKAAHKGIISFGEKERNKIWEQIQ